MPLPLARDPHAAWGGRGKGKGKGKYINLTRRSRSSAAHHGQRFCVCLSLTLYLTRFFTTSLLSLSFPLNRRHSSVTQGLSSTPSLHRHTLHHDNTTAILNMEAKEYKILSLGPMQHGKMAKYELSEPPKPTKYSGICAQEGGKAAVAVLSCLMLLRWEDSCGLLAEEKG
ncbi:hypothetical protein IWX90DRAFT_56549 [Phyllosticta citrichinensis]|uniref:Uncharacterized protein n=1 Tax=Phyllosticta citrichinensis TaxID=1130410 RepID=A0ABR1XJ41_9PEZI